MYFICDFEIFITYTKGILIKYVLLKVHIHTYVGIITIAIRKIYRF